MQHRKSSFIPEPTHMLYKQPGDKFLHGDYFTTTIVKESDLTEYLSHGWFKTSTEAKNKNCEGAVNLSQGLTNKELAYKVLAELGYSEDQINGSSVLADDLKADFGRLSEAKAEAEAKAKASVIIEKKRGPGRPRLSA